MKNKFTAFVAIFVAATMVWSCKPKEEPVKELSEMEKKVNEFASFKLTTDLSKLTEKEKQMLPLLLEVAQIMDDIFWQQTYGEKAALLSRDSLTEAEKQFIMLNYGPWEHLNDNKPFIAGFGEKPAGANYYPADMTKEEFDAFADPAKNSMYTVLRRDSLGKLTVIPYYVEYKEEVTRAAELLNQAAALAEDAGLKKYLELRAQALLTDDYLASDMAWMDMKTAGIDFVCGPIENYDDALFGLKAAHEAYLLVKDKEWSKKLERFAALLPVLQKALPIDAKYKKDKPGADSDLNAYDVVYYAGDCNAGSKTIAINLPNDERVQNAKGSRRLQLKNAMQAKFEKIMDPISKLIIDSTQQQYVKFDAFFENVMFHEAAHGIGVKNTINGKGMARAALKEQYSAIEEGKADILGLWVITELTQMKEMGEKDLNDNYITYFAGIFRSVRFGAASAHGKANMLVFNYFADHGVFEYNTEKGTYKVDVEKMKVAVKEIANMILVMQGDGNYEEAKRQIETNSVIRESLQADLQRIGDAGIPRDIVFEQGKAALGL